MVEEKFILRLLGYILILTGTLALSLVSFGRGHVEQWLLDYIGIAGAILLINGSALLLKSVWKR
jgi:hypothetical protein